MNYLNKFKVLILTVVINIAFVTQANAYVINEPSARHFQHFQYFNSRDEARAACKNFMGFGALCLGHGPGWSNIPGVNDNLPIGGVSSGWHEEELSDGTNNLHFIKYTFPYFVLNDYAPHHSQCKVGNPINLEQGTKEQVEKDYFGQTFSLKRYYNSSPIIASRTIGSFWRHSYEAYMNFTQPKAIADHSNYNLGSPKRLTSNKSFSTSPKLICESKWTFFMWEYRGGIYAKKGYAVLEGDNICEVRSYSNDEILVSFLVNPSTGFLLPREEKLEEKESHTISLPNGITYVFKLQGDKYAELYGSPVFLEHELGLWRFIDTDGMQYIFNEDGLLAQLVEHSGKKHTLTRDASERIQTIEIDGGFKFQVEYNENFLIESVSNGVYSVGYVYDDNLNLSKVVYPDESTKTYHYENEVYTNALTGITGQDGNRFASWEYNNDGKAIASYHGSNKERVDIDYSYFDDADSPRITTTSSLGKKTTYYYENILGQRRVSRVEGHETENCLSANSHYSYYPNGLIESKTKRNGSKTMYFYNESGQEISRTEAVDTLQARTIKTEWHPDLAKPIKMIEPERTTEYTYDDNGRLVNTKITGVPL